MLEPSWYGTVAHLPSNAAAEEADDGMIYRYGGFTDKGSSGQLRVSSRFLREAQLDEQPGLSDGASSLLGMYLCTCCTTSSKKVLRDTPPALPLSRETQATPCSDRQCFYCLQFPLPCFLVHSFQVRHQRASSLGCWFRDPPCALPRKRRRQTTRVAALNRYTKVKDQPVSSQPASQPSHLISY